MEVLTDFNLFKPATVAELAELQKHHPKARYLAGGTDLLVNMRRGIVDAGTLIDVCGLTELGAVEADAEGGLSIGAAVKLADLAADDLVRGRFPVIAAAAAEVAGPTHREMGTVGGNLCLDTRCVYYNQSEWWRNANDYCLKYRGDVCHVAPKSKRCYAAYSGDLAPALLVLNATVDVVVDGAERSLALADLYNDDGENYLALGTGAFVARVRVPPLGHWRAAYRKVRVRDAIDFPLAGVAVALAREGEVLTHLAIACTGVAARPLLIAGTDELLGATLNEAAESRIGRLFNKQIQPMRSTFSPASYRRHVANNLVIDGIRRLWNQH